MLDPHVETTQSHRTLWLKLAIVVAILGIAVATYSTNHQIQFNKLGKTDSVCNIKESLNCDTIAADSFAMILDVPLATWGLGYFLANLTLLFLALSHRAKFVEYIQTYSLMVLIGVLTSVFFFYRAEFTIGVLCPSCMASYGVNILQGLLLIIFRKQIPRNFTLTSLVYGGLVATLVVFCVAISYLLMF